MAKLSRTEKGEDKIRKGGFLKDNKLFHNVLKQGPATFSNGLEQQDSSLGQAGWLWQCQEPGIFP